MSSTLFFFLKTTLATQALSNSARISRSVFHFWRRQGDRGGETTGIFRGSVLNPILLWVVSSYHPGIRDVFPFILVLTSFCKFYRLIMCKSLTCIVKFAPKYVVPPHANVSGTVSSIAFADCSPLVLWKHN